MNILIIRHFDMFDDYYIGGQTINVIMENQGSVISHFLGDPPNEIDRHHSPFRTDSNPDCRFSYSNNVWYFIDNATYKNRLAFNCIQLVQYMFDISYQEAIAKISEEVELKIVGTSPIFFTPKIEVELIKMPEINYYTNLGISNEYLHRQKIGKVNNYLANTRKHHYPVLSAYYNPKTTDTYCFYLEGGKELYFPGQNIKYVKERHGQSHYGVITEDYLVVTEGNNDRMILDYHYNLNSIGLQNVYSSPDLSKVKQLFILLDPDLAGVAGAKRLLAKYPNAINLTSMLNKYDICDMYLKDKDRLNLLVKKIKDAT
jgi:hypothetical protein